MRLPTLTSHRLLVVAPHPDDEVIGSWGLIRAAKVGGAQVRVVVASDGGASHTSSLGWPRTRLVRQRRRETLWALRTLRVSAADVRFLGLPDGALHACAPILRTAFHQELRHDPAPDLLVGPTVEDDHPDHRAVANALNAVAPPRLRRLAYGVWSAHAAPAEAAPWRAPIAGTPWAKRFALRLHRSQGGLISDDPNGFTLTASQVQAFARPIETFRRIAPRP